TVVYYVIILKINGFRKGGKMSNSIFLTNATLIDGKGGVVVDHTGILIKNDCIVAVGSSEDIDVPEKAVIKDLTGKYIMPGLIDCHVHFMGGKSLNLATNALESPQVQMGRALNDLEKLIDAGFTTVRDVGSIHAIHMKTLLDEGEYSGPNIETPYKILSQTA